jgi:hypothetical protein
MKQLRVRRMKKLIRKVKNLINNITTDLIVFVFFAIIGIFLTLAWVACLPKIINKYLR